MSSLSPVLTGSPSVGCGPCDHSPTTRMTYPVVDSIQQEQQAPASDPTTFSFRMFDLYRRFVEILQLSPELLAGFRAGAPTDEDCRFLVKRAFILKQSDERLTGLVRYLGKNARSIAEHADRQPSNWPDAVRYTNDCIKMIRKHLHAKGIQIKSFVADEKRINELATEIAAEMYDEPPMEQQIQDIRDYLTHDLKNPKRTIISSTPKTLKNRKKESEKTCKIKNPGDKHDKKRKLKIKIKKSLAKDSLEVETSPKNNKLLKVTNENAVNTELFKSPNINESEEYSSAICDPISKKLMDLECKKSPSEFRVNESNLSEKISKDLYQSVLQNSFQNEVTIEYNESSISTEENGEKHYLTENLPHYLMRLKRNISYCDGINGLFNPNDSTDNSQIKESFSNDSLTTQSDDCVNSNNNTNKTSDFELMKESNSGSTESGVDVESSNNFNINVDKHTEEEFCAPTINNNTEQCKISPPKSIPTKLEIKKENISQTELCELENSNFPLESKSRYSEVANMTYSQVQKLIDTVMAFCEFKNEITLEEFLVLRRTRDKMHWRSLKELN